VGGGPFGLLKTWSGRGGRHSSEEEGVKATKRYRRSAWVKKGRQIDKAIVMPCNDTKGGGDLGVRGKTASWGTVERYPQRRPETGKMGADETQCRGVKGSSIQRSVSRGDRYFHRQKRWIGGVLTVLSTNESEAGANKDWDVGFQQKKKTPRNRSRVGFTG